MPLKGLTFQSGVIKNVDATKGTCSIMSNLDGSTVDNVPIDAPDFARYIPEENQSVLFMKLDDYHPSIVKYFSANKFIPTTKPGEFDMTSKAGQGGHVLLDNGGNVMISDEFFSNVMQIIADEGIQLSGDNYQIKIKNTGTINIDQKNKKIEIIKSMPFTDVPMTTITLEDDKVTIGSLKIELGSTTVGGCVYSMSNVPGPHSFCLVTGLPIPASTSVKVQP